MNRFKSLYTNLAIILLNTLCALLIINLILGAVYFAHDAYAKRKEARQVRLFNDDGSPVNNGRRSAYQLDWFDYNATKEVKPEEVGEVLDDFYQLSLQGFIYQPWVQFSEPPFAGKHLSVDIDDRGFPIRRTANPAIDNTRPVINILVLGGSTTFGYNVADEQTWPSYLSAILNEKARSGSLAQQVHVTNYGRGYYDTSQEMALLIDLLKNGQRPNLVLFMDGVNWGPDEDIPEFTPQLERAVDYTQHGSERAAMDQFKSWLGRWVPMFRLMFSLKSRLQKPPAPGQQAQATGNTLTQAQQEHVARILERFRQNRNIIKSVCHEYGIETIFFIQPDAVYNYPANLYRRPLPPSYTSNRVERQLFHEQISKSQELIYLGNLFTDYGIGPDRKAILDDVHYSPNFNRFLAERVASEIDLQRIANSPASNSAMPTGAKRRVSHGE